MREKDIHELIERQNPEAKQRILNKVLNNLPELTEQITGTERNELDHDCNSNRDKEKSPR